MYLNLWSALCIWIISFSLLLSIFLFATDDKAYKIFFTILIISFTFSVNAFYFIPAKKDVTRVEVINKFVTKKQIIIELENGEIKVLKDIKYLNDSLIGFEITHYNTYGTLLNKTYEIEEK